MLPFSVKLSGVQVDIPDGYVVKYKTGGEFKYPSEAKILLNNNWETFWVYHRDPVWKPEHITIATSMLASIYPQQTFQPKTLEEVVIATSMGIELEGKFTLEPIDVQEIVVTAALAFDFTAQYTFEPDNVEVVTISPSLAFSFVEQITIETFNLEELTIITSLDAGFTGVVGNNHWEGLWEDHQINANTARLLVRFTTTGLVQIIRGTVGGGGEFSLLSENIKDIYTSIPVADIEVLAVNNSTNDPLSNTMATWIPLNTNRTLIVELDADGVYVEESWLFTLYVRDKNNFGITNSAQLTLTLSVES